MFPAVAAIDRKRACNVRCIAVDLGARIDQQEFAVLKTIAIFRVVQDAGVGAASNDRRVGWRTGAALSEFIFEFTFDLELILIRATPGTSRM